MSDWFAGAVDAWRMVWARLLAMGFGALIEHLLAYATTLMGHSWPGPPKF